MDCKVIEIINTILLTLITVVGSVWAVLRLIYKYKAKVLFITNCQILHKTLWDDICGKLKIEKHGKRDFAFRPLVLLPESMKKYSNVRNGEKAILECKNRKTEVNLMITAEVFWIPPDLGDWGNIKHPAFSLILRRYFGIERPLYEASDLKELNESDDWKVVRHSNKHLDPLNYQDENYNIWAVSKDYSFRYFNPSAKNEKLEYETVPNENNFIEYCGLSIVLRKKSIANFE